ncbi:MAG: GNAT family N-acetyltransferase [Ramlibacter sp.]|nr:GNAT family N-acetyltransferase [Cryobacterium sp.]
MVLAARLSATVTLRLLEQGDSAWVAAAYVRNRAHLAPWEPTRPEEFFTTAWQEEEISRLLAGCQSGAGLPMVLVTEDAVIGRVTLSGITRGAFQSANLGYWIDGRHAGQGLMTAAVGALLARARDDLELHRVQAETLLHNVASQRVLQRAGFEHIGMAPRYLRIAGTWQDHELFQRVLVSARG